MVDFSRPIGIAFINLADELETILQMKVDLVSKGGIKPTYFAVIQPDLIYVCLSRAEDIRNGILQDQTCRGAAYWSAFLDMMVENPFDALTIWNLHPYPFLIKPKSFPEASPTHPQP
jgi:hypothetical protein